MTTRALDECDNFGAFIANKLRTYTQHTRSYVQHLRLIFYSVPIGVNMNTQTMDTRLLKPPVPQTKFRHPLHTRICTQATDTRLLKPPVLQTNKVHKWPLDTRICPKTTKTQGPRRKQATLRHLHPKNQFIARSVMVCWMNFVTW
jgi:hypothetical protein